MSRQVAANLARLRQERGLSTTRLAAALEDLGQPIPPTGITRIEKGQRRVDSDDLVALAVALNVSPTALLLPPANDQSPVGLTSAFEVTARTAWKWAEGEQTAVDYEISPITSTGGDPAVAVERLEQQQDFERRQATYLTLTHPWGPGAGEHQAVRLSRDLADAVEALVSAEPDAPRGDLDAKARMAQRRYSQLGPELDELADRIPPVHPGIQPRDTGGA
ncbi:helix-turn-helix transcriptional regulator [Streptomyces sp. NPDC048281]|uniref:helix-turn-helix domain-containing protein n=1 Tax=Streptomyces sp. NPDC048281 TaxID=3154715 RepID=UPI0034451FDC